MFVMPADAGIQKIPERLDSRFRGNDVRGNTNIRENFEIGSRNRYEGKEKPIGHSGFSPRYMNSQYAPAPPRAVSNSVR